jgi:hypothetical protein
MAARPGSMGVSTAPGGEPSTLTAVLDTLRRAGFTVDFGVGDRALRIPGSPRLLRPADLAIREYHRFEGVSDPDDMAIVYAIEAGDGTRGTLVDAFGVYANPAVGALLSDVPIRGRPPEGTPCPRR